MHSYQTFVQTKHHSFCSKQLETVKGRKPRIGNLGSMPGTKVPFVPERSISLVSNRYLDLCLNPDGKLPLC